MKEDADEASQPKWLSASLRWLLWGVLAFLLIALVGTVVWLAGRYETSRAQASVERDAADALGDLRSALTRNLQSLQALQAGEPTREAWMHSAAAMLHDHRELVRLEWRDPQLGTIAAVDSPYRSPVFEKLGRANSQPDVQQACLNARRINSASYERSYFVPQVDGLGLEVLELCVGQVSGGRLTGYVVATYALPEMLASMIGPEVLRSHEVSFTEADGTRLAVHGVARRGSRVFTSQQLVDLPGATMVLRVDAWRAAPDVFPNVLTALVTAMSIALIVVLFMLGHDMRRRMRAELDLADALAFRKAMEDSLVTGLRARDLQGRTTYVNPAFSNMVGFTPEEILRTHPPPYWPPESAEDYRKRQAIRLASDGVPPREGYESVFMRKDGTRFPVLIIEAPLINVHGVQTGWMSAVLDISEQRRVEELSRASQDRLQATARLATVGEMASLLSHELNQPLAAIASYATGSLNLLHHPDKSGSDSNFAARREGEAATVHAGLDTELADSLELAMNRIAEQADRAGRVIKSVHDFVRRRDKEREHVLPRVLIDAVLPLVNLQARKLGVRVDTRVSDDLPGVQCDRTMVEQVLLNLARNAMQAMDGAKVADPWLRIQVRRVAPAESAGGKAWLEFSVADCGPGIPEDVKQQLFTPFFTTKAEGMGLGLSLCRTVVEQHGGFLGFEPQRPQGTIFRFTLPAAPGPGG
ncbi:MAG TPA: ATP-binding protein [Ramlibacter sp.]|uniref:sensor histidine kinase n=1 Tax=Ramlibacter sp. TaxID=1917967 RepID=UPI002C72D474|nr:ATP-binding protein [Ramlibacter sp.]HVZ47098.1 ATP-binding protein [Ramlibacter sp.]